MSLELAQRRIALRDEIIAKQRKQLSACEAEVVALRAVLRSLEARLVALSDVAVVRPE